LALAALLIFACSCRLVRGSPRGDDVLVLPDETRDAVESIRESRALSRACSRAAALVASRHASEGLAITDIGLAVIDLRRGRLGQFNGYEGFEASELIALPLGVEAMRQRAMGHVTEAQIAAPVTRRTVDGDVGEINAMVDMLTGTTSGETLIGPGLEEFLDRRKTVDRSLQAQGLFGICAAHHLSEQSPTGREQQAAERIRPPINQMTAADTARLLALVSQGEIITRSGAGRLLATVARPAGPVEVMERLPRGLPDGTRVWGLAGWTRRANHGAWVVALPDGRRLVVVALVRMDRDAPEVVSELGEQMILGSD
jgi:hypothetical protein